MSQLSISQILISQPLISRNIVGTHFLFLFVFQLLLSQTIGISVNFLGPYTLKEIISQTD